MIARLFIALALLLPTSIPVPTSGTGPSRISIRLHDYSGVTDGDLSAAEAQVSAIYETAGVHFDWRDPVRPTRLRSRAALCSEIDLLVYAYSTPYTTTLLWKEGRGDSSQARQGSAGRSPS